MKGKGNWFVMSMTNSSQRNIASSVNVSICMQDTFARATHSAYTAGRPSAARDDRVSCIQCTKY